MTMKENPRAKHLSPGFECADAWKQNFTSLKMIKTGSKIRSSLQYYGWKQIVCQVWTLKLISAIFTLLMDILFFLQIISASTKIIWLSSGEADNVLTCGYLYQWLTLPLYVEMDNMARISYHNMIYLQKIKGEIQL